MIWPFENDTSAIIKNMAQKSIAFDKKKNLFCISAIVVAVAMIMMSSTGRGIQSAHHVKKGGLATAGSSNNSHKLSILHRNINSIKGTSNIRLCTVILFQVNRL